MTNRLEKIVRRVAKELEENQRAKLWKLPNDLRITSSGEAVWGEKGPADFFGHTITGRAVFIECKDIKSGCLSMGTRGIKAHQWIALAEMTRCGGIGLFIWAHEDEVAVLGTDLIYSLARGRKSVSWKSIPPENKHELGHSGIMDLLKNHSI